MTATTGGERHFEITKLLGHGGMGVVHAAVDRRSGKVVALKRIQPRLHHQATVLARFEREARAQSRIRSPFVVSVLDVGHDADGPYLAMELLEGETLEKRLLRDVRLSVEDTLAVGDQLLAGTEAAHRAGVIHRDLSPANVFVAQTPEGERVKILDFGISKLEGQGGGTLTETGEILGTIAHIAPERFAGRPATHRSDLWSVGVLLYRCLAGKNPFEAANEFAAITRITNSKPAPLPDVVDARTREAFAPFFARAFEKDPAKRHASADEMRGALADVRAMVTGTRRLSPVPKPAPPAPSSVRPLARRSLRMPIAALACAALGAWFGASMRPTDPKPVASTFAVDTESDATITLDGLMVIDRSRIPLPPEPSYVLRVSAPDRVTRDVALPARPGSRLRVRLAKAEAPVATALPSPSPSPSRSAGPPLSPAHPHSAAHAPVPVARPHATSSVIRPITRPPY